MVGLFLDVFVEYLIRVIGRAIKRRRSRGWPTVRATVASSKCPQSSGCNLAEVTYLYSFNGERYSGTNKKPFLRHDSAAEYIGHFVPSTEFTVRVKPDDPEVSIVP
jgi:Protein of unknown function (DUF3592)